MRCAVLKIETICDTEKPVEEMIPEPFGALE